MDAQLASVDECHALHQVTLTQFVTNWLLDSLPLMSSFSFFLKQRYALLYLRHAIDVCNRNRDSPHLNYVVYQGMPEISLQLQVVVLEDVLKRSPGAVLGQQIRHVGIDAGANESHQVVVVQILHTIPVLSENE